MADSLVTLDHIRAHLDSIDLDVRVSQNGRWIDQKVTPDVLSAVADAVLNHRLGSPDKEFTMASLWEDPRLDEIMREVFSKPGLENPSANNEYDKVISQPLLALSYAKVIDLHKRSGRNFFKLNHSVGILKFIAHREVNAYKYLCLYLPKVLKDSGEWQYFDRFIDSGRAGIVSSSDYSELKNRFVAFTIKNTRINNEVEARRIFTKVLNPIACQYGIRGTYRGRLSPHKINYSELLYNRDNFRDLDKDKGLTREEYRQALNLNPAFKYTVNKAVKQIRERYAETELLDGSEITRETVIHHIFMKHERPFIAGHLENLVSLTPNQHVTKAHPSMNFSVIDPGYQKLFILKKVADTRQSENDRDGFYTKEGLIEVLNVGLGGNHFHESDSYSEITTKIGKIYLDRYSIPSQPPL